jgi:hypothetical protein
MSVPSRMELLIRWRPEYLSGDWQEKHDILDKFCDLSGYGRKHAITLFNQEVKKAASKPAGRHIVYGPEVVQALTLAWQACDCACSKRLAPFLPSLVDSLEYHNHMSLAAPIRAKLLSMSASTIDRLLRDERYLLNRGSSRTIPGPLLRHQIPVRTFNDWSDLRPGFFEVDCVSHCGGYKGSPHLETLVMTDVSTGWTVYIALSRRSGENVVAGIKYARSILPFAILGIDTDNGGEFINHDLVDYCRDEQIDFTRSRKYRKNDQAHVEERNGTVVRRNVGYDRFEGEEACAALKRVYETLSVYQSYFQPYLKRVTKTKDAGKVTKKYDKAQTPMQRLLGWETLTEAAKDAQLVYHKSLDPIELLAELRCRQSHLWQQAWRPALASTWPSMSFASSEAAPSAIEASPPRSGMPGDAIAPLASITNPTNDATQYLYRRTRRPRRKKPDPIAPIWDKVLIHLKADPFQSCLSLFAKLQQEYPGRIHDAAVGRLDVRVSAWRHQMSHEVIKKAADKVSLAQFARGRPRKSATETIIPEMLDMLRADPFISAVKIHAALQAKFPSEVQLCKVTIQNLRNRWRNEVRSAILRDDPQPPTDQDRHRALWQACTPGGARRSSEAFTIPEGS